MRNPIIEEDLRFIMDSAISREILEAKNILIWGMPFYKINITNRRC